MLEITGRYTLEDGRAGLPVAPPAPTDWHSRGDKLVLHPATPPVSASAHPAAPGDCTCCQISRELCAQWSSFSASSMAQLLLHDSCHKRHRRTQHVQSCAQAGTAGTKGWVLHRPNRVFWHSSCSCSISTLGSEGGSQVGQLAGERGNVQTVESDAEARAWENA